MLRPILRRMDAMNVRIDELAEHVHRHLPIIENAIESQNAELRARARKAAVEQSELDRLRDDLTQTRQQVEALQRRLGLVATATQLDPRPQRVEAVPSPAQAEHLEAEGGELRVNFCCGPQSMPGHVSVNVQALRGGGLADCIRALPFGERSATEVRASLAIEQFSITELRSIVLPYWHSLLRPGAHFTAVSLDAEANVADCQAGRLTFEQFAMLSFGSEEGSSAERRSMLSESLLARLLEDTGFESVETVGRWRDGVVNQMEVRAKRGGRTVLAVDGASPTTVSA